VIDRGLEVGPQFLYGFTMKGDVFRRALRDLEQVWSPAVKGRRISSYPLLSVVICGKKQKGFFLPKLRRRGFVLTPDGFDLITTPSPATFNRFADAAGHVT
jgi:hypothetical protein